MNTVVIVPMFKNQLIILYRQGFNTIDSSRIIFAKLKNDLPVIPEGILESRLPVFEEDFELLLIELELNISIQIIQNKVTTVPHLEQPLEISFQDIKRIYPLSERGAKSLNLGEGIKLEKPIFENEVKKAENSFRLKGYFLGGSALLKILGLDNQLIINNLENFKSSFVEAFEFRNNPKTQAGDLPDNSQIIVKVLCYERYGGIFPNNDLGLLCDVGLLFAQSQGAKTFMDSKFVVTLIQQNDREYRNLTFSQVVHLLDTPKYTNLKQRMEEHNFFYITYLFYFKFREILREGSNVSDSIFPEIISEFKDSKYKDNLIIATWLVGSFFGFSSFFEEFYKSNAHHQSTSENNSAKKIDKEKPEQSVNQSKKKSEEVIIVKKISKKAQAEELPENIISEVTQNYNEDTGKKKGIPFEITNNKTKATPNLEKDDDLFTGPKVE